MYDVDNYFPEGWEVHGNNMSLTYKGTHTVSVYRTKRDGYFQGVRFSIWTYGVLHHPEQSRSIVNAVLIMIAMAEKEAMVETAREYRYREAHETIKAAKEKEKWDAQNNVPELEKLLGIKKMGLFQRLRAWIRVTFR